MVGLKGLEGNIAMKKQSILTAFKVSAMLAASLALGSALGCHRDPNVEKQKYLASGKRYADQGKYKEAEIQFANALKVDKNFAAAHYELSKAYLKTGSMLPAYSELLRTVDLQPGNIPARIDLGNMLVAGRQADRAAEQANAVLAIDSNNADAHALLSTIAASKNDRPTAIAEIQKALAVDPKKASFHAAYGLLQAGDPGNEASAESQLHQAVELDTKNATAHLVLAALLERKGDIPGATEQYKQGIAADPKNVSARANFATFLLRQGDKAQAEAVVLQATGDLADTPEGAQLMHGYLVRTNQADREESIYADLNAKHPTVPIKLVYARVLLGRKEIDKARPVIADLVKLNGSNPDVVVLNAALMVNDGKLNDAYSALLKAAKNNPDNLEVKLRLAAAAVAKGEYQVAEQSYLDATHLNPRSVEAQDGLATMAMRKNDFTTLAQVANTVIGMAPQYSPAYVWRGVAEANQKEPEKAEADYRQALKLNPKNAIASLELAYLLVSQKHFPEARTLLDQTLANDPNSSRALSLQVALDLNDKQPDKAIARVQDQITKSPNNSEMYDELSQLQLMTGNKDGALDSAGKAMKINPADSAAVMAFARAQIAHGNPTQAIATWQQWVKDHPTDAGAYTILGSLQDSQGDKDAATASYKKALAIQPEQGVAANNLAYLMLQSGQNVDVALSLAETARRAMPNAPSTADTLGWAYYNKASYYSARDLFEDALKTAPNDPSIHYHLGMTYSKLDDKANAILHLKKAATIAPDSTAGKDAQKALASLS